MSPDQVTFSCDGRAFSGIPGEPVAGIPADIDRQRDSAAGLGCLVDRNRRQPLRGAIYRRKQ